MQTEATKLALIRDNYECQYHKWVLGERVNIFVYRPGYHPAMAGGHHVVGRGREDLEELIIGLCSECHTKAQTYKIPRKAIFAILSKIVGIDLYRKYPQYCKWTDEEWNEVYP